MQHLKRSDGIVVREEKEKKLLPLFLQFNLTQLSGQKGFTPKIDANYMTHVCWGTAVGVWGGLSPGCPLSKEELKGKRRIYTGAKGKNDPKKSLNAPNIWGKGKRLPPIFSAKFILIYLSTLRGKWEWANRGGNAHGMKQVLFGVQVHALSAF